MKQEDAPLNQKNTEVDTFTETRLYVKENRGRFLKKCSYICQNVTVEPFGIVFVISYMVTLMLSQNLYLEKACKVNLNYSDKICQSLKQNSSIYNKYEMEVQKLTASALAFKSYINFIIPGLFSLFSGSWSDKTGYRKIFLIIPIVGQLLICINNLIQTYFFYELSLQVVVFSEGILETLTGGGVFMFQNIFAYISVITNEKTRTFRMGIVNFFLTAGFPVGTAFSGVLLQNWGYYGSYTFCLVLQVISLTLCVLLVKDAKRTKDQKKHDGLGFLHFLRTFFDLSNIKDTLKVVFKKGPNNRRTRMCVLLAVVCVLFGPMYGEMSILYLSTRYRFNWDEVKFSIFQTYNFITHTIGTIFSITVFSKYLQWHDSILGIISTISKIAASFVYCFAPNERIFYLAPLVDILNGTSLLAMRSIISKLVDPFELGKVNSIVGLTENLMPLVYVSLYTKVYTSTMEVLPGFVFLMGSLMTIPAVIVFLWLLYEHRKGLRKSKQNEAETPIRHDVD